MSSKTFKKGVLASSIAMVLAGGAAPLAMANDGADKDVEVIEVTGIRGSTKASINTKRFANSQVDGISAEDIGKLPDVTITDSLQRITGVQIERVAGEGGAIQIRGLPEIDTTMNGETFLSATTIDTSGADLGDLPAQLFSGVDVYKSATSNNVAQGIAGAIDLKTRRPFDMDEGWKFAGGVEATRGSITEETDPTLHGLVSYNAEKWGFLVSAVSQDVTLATDFNGHNDTSENGGYGWTFGGTTGPEGDDGVMNITPHGFTAFNKTEERERNAIQASFQADLGDGFTLTADYFYTNQDRFNARSGFNINSRWAGSPTFANAIEYTDDKFQTADGTIWKGVNKFNAAPTRLQSFTQVNINEEKSRNFNLQLDYDNGGALTGQVRFTDATATAKMRHGYGEGDIMSIDEGAFILGPGGLLPAQYCNNGEEIVGSEGGCYGEYSKGIEDQNFFISHDASGEHPVFGGFDQVVSGGKGELSVADYMADKDSYHVGAFSSEGNTDDDADMRTFSTKWNYAFEDHDFITSVDFGIRYSKRTIDHDQFTYTSDFGDGCDIAQWKAVDQNIDRGTSNSPSNDCYAKAGTGEFTSAEQGDFRYNEETGEYEQVFHYQYDKDTGEKQYVPKLDDNGDPIYGDLTWTPYSLLPPTRIDQHTTASFQTNFGNVKGIPGVWVIDPSNFRDPRQFHLNTFGNVKRTENGGKTYDVGLDELSYFVQVNFEYEKLSGNVGVKVIETDLNVKQNLIGANLPHSGLGPDIGDVLTERSYKDELPSLNLAYQLTDDVVLRAAYSENMQALDLAQWGEGKRVGMSFNDACGCMRVVDVTYNGDPNLNPWRSENVSFSAEWYAGEASMFYSSLFQIKIEEFTEQVTEDRSEEPDLDGIVRGPHPTTFYRQAKGGEVSGFELGSKVAFGDFLGEDSIFANVGFDLNYTYTDSKQEAKDIRGDDLPFEGMSEDTYNAVVWYENDVFSARLAYNSRSPRLISSAKPALGGQALYQDTFNQLDFNATYNFNDNISFYVNGSNITEEYQQAYIEFKDQKAFQNVYEARWTVGTRIIF